MSGFVVGLESEDGEVAFVVGSFVDDVGADEWMEAFLRDHPDFDRDFAWVSQVTDPQDAGVAEFFN